MYAFYLDASGLVKRYTQEIGTESVDFLFQNVPLNRLMCLAIGAAEVFSVCVRLHIATDLRNENNGLVLVASDQRLLRAAQGQGILCYNPEKDAQHVLARWVNAE